MPKKEKAEYRSRCAIKAALVQLLERKPYASVTVQNILDASGYSRGTFYAHFLDKDDLMKQLILDEVAVYGALTFNSVEEVHNRYFTCQERDNVSQGMLSFFEHVYEEQKLYQAICNRKLPGMSLHYLGDLFYQWSVEHVKISSVPPYDTFDLDLYMYQVAHTRTQYIEYWIKHNFAQSPQYMAQQLASLCRIDIPFTVQKSIKNQQK